MKKDSSKEKDNDITHVIKSPINIHQEYIVYHDKVDLNEFSDAQLKEERNKILKKKVFLEEKKKIIFLLAHKKALWALYGIQKYLKNPDPKLAEWALIAWQECQAGVLNSALEKFGFAGEEEEPIVMGGLGGKDKSLRYCFALSTKIEDFSKENKDKVLAALKEIELQLNTEVEEIIFNKNYARIVILVPYDIAVGTVIENIILYANKTTLFLRDHYFVINTHILSNNEIEEYIRELNNS